MKVIYAILIILFLTPAIANAGQIRKVKDVRNYKTELSLTDQQMVKLNSIATNYQSRAKLMQPAADGKEKMKQRAALRKEMRKEMAAVLSKDQFQKYVQLRQAGNKK